MKLGLPLAECGPPEDRTATLRLLEKLHLSPDDAVVGVLASAEVATSESAMGECLNKAGTLAGTLDGTNWEIFEAIAGLTDERRAKAQEIRGEVRKALVSDEHVKQLAPALRGAQAKAVLMLTKPSAQPALPLPQPPPGPGLQPEVRPGWRVVGQGSRDGLTIIAARGMYRRIEARLASPARGFGSTWAGSSRREVAPHDRDSTDLQSDQGTGGCDPAEEPAGPGDRPAVERPMDGRERASTWIGISTRFDQCDSPLAILMALREPMPDGATRVLITPLDEGELGDDILLRLAKRRLFQIDSWQIVRSLFQARAVDPGLTRHGLDCRHAAGSNSLERLPGGPRGISRRRDGLADLASAGSRTSGRVARPLRAFEMDA